MSVTAKVLVLAVFLFAVSNQSFSKIGVSIKSISSFYTGEIEILVNLLKEYGNQKGWEILTNNQTLKKLSEDEVVEEAFETKRWGAIRELREKYDIEGIIRVIFSMDIRQGIGPYYVGKGKCIAQELMINEGGAFILEIESDSVGLPGEIPSIIGRSVEDLRLEVVRRVSVNVIEKLKNLGPGSLNSFSSDSMEISLLQLASRPAMDFFPYQNLKKEFITEITRFIETEENESITCAGVSNDEKVGAVCSYIVTDNASVVPLSSPWGQWQARGMIRTYESRIYLVDLVHKTVFRILICMSSKELPHPPKYSKKITACSFSPDWRFLAVVTETPKLFIWDIYSGKLLVVLDIDSQFTPVSVRFSTNGKFLVIEGKRGGNLFYKISSRGR